MTSRTKITSQAPRRLPPGTIQRIHHRYLAGREVEWLPRQAAVAVDTVPEWEWAELFRAESVKLCREFSLRAEDLAAITGPDLMVAAAISVSRGDPGVLTRQAGRVRRLMYDADVRELLRMAA